MVSAIEVMVDVSEVTGLPRPCEVAATVHLPEPGHLADPPVVCVAFPGGGYGRRYFSFDLPGSSGGGQAGYHAARGWVVVTVDHLGVGDSTLPPAESLTFETLAAADHAAVEEVTRRLAAGIAPGFPAVADPVLLGIGQSMGGCLLIVTQGQHRTFAGVGVLGFSAIHTVVPSRPGTPPLAMPWMPRGLPIVLNEAALAAVGGPVPGEHPFAWAFHFDDEPADVVAADMALDALAPPSAGPIPPWRSATVPACAIQMVAPGVVAAEAAAIRVPVLVAAGERDVVPDPRAEPRAYQSAPDVTVFVCPGMAHMHNFARTRERLWARLHHWGTGVVSA